MKKLYRAALLAAIGLAGVTAARADSGGDLIVGFTVGSSTDVYFNLGAASALTSGETWNVNAALTAAGLDSSLSTVQWGVLGDYKNGGTASHLTAFTWASTGDGSIPETISGSSAWSAYQTPINSIIGSAGAFNGNLGASGNYGTIDGSSQNSWYSESISPSLGTQWFNVSGGIAANATGEASDILWQITDNGSAPVELGGLTLDDTGTLTFEPVPEPSTCTILGGAGMLIFSLCNRGGRKQA
jgi:hypothetical protein